MLVADHPSVVAQVRDALDGQGHELEIVRTPQRAVAQVEAGNVYDVIVGDNDTHPTGGLALAREIKALWQLGQQDVPPVVLLIARPQDTWLANWAQADAHVLKPADPFDLLETLEAVAAGQPVPALPGVGGEPTPSLLDPEPKVRLAPGGSPAQPLEAGG